MIQSYPLYKFFNIATTSAGVQIITGSGVLHTVNINTPVVGQIVTVYDGTSTTGSKICSITTPTTSPYPTASFDVKYKTGLFIVTTTGAADLTVAYL